MFQDKSCWLFYKYCLLVYFVFFLITLLSFFIHIINKETLLNLCTFVFEAFCIQFAQKERFFSILSIHLAHEHILLYTKMRRKNNVQSLFLKVCECSFHTSKTIFYIFFFRNIHKSRFIVIPISKRSEKRLEQQLLRPAGSQCALERFH